MSDWYPTLEEYNPNISVEQWKELVLDKEIFNEKSLFTFACLLKAKETSCYAMAEEFSYNKWNLEPFNFFSAQIRSTGQRVAKKINLVSESFWNICCIGRKNSENHFCFVIRPELKKAFDETGILKSIILNELDENYCNFKKLLEYFVVHLEYINNEKVDIGYEYIKDFIENGSFKTAGQGWNGGKIQNQIKVFDTYFDKKIFIGIKLNPSSKNYKSKQCYLTWEKTSVNIIAEWTINKISNLVITNWAESIGKKFEKTMSLNDLGLFDNQNPNDNLKSFFNDYYKLYKNTVKEKVYLMSNKNLTSYINLLESNKNIIFHGAPGTGKTYLAKQIAKQMIFGFVKDDSEMSEAEKKLFDKHFVFVQFHPSYDYTDFVEGLRPVKNSELNQINFERKDGVFKAFCKRALKDFKDLQKTNENLKEEYSFVSAFSDLCEKYRTGEISEITLRDNNYSMIINGINDEATVLYLKTKNSDKQYTISSNRLSKLAEKFKTIEDLDSISNIYKSITEIIGGCHSSGYWATLRKIYEIKEEQKIEPNIKVEDLREFKDKPFIFLIDEINRGELSKIFGELFYCVDAGYRGEKGKIATQYQNLIEDYDEYENGFFIPENVYIIGTMNDIDRSVECMDFAMRRRFTFIEITAAESAENMNLCEESKKRMKNLNDTIEEIGLTSSFHIGASYFKTAEDNAKDGEIDYKSLWKLNFKPLLQEYLRGNDMRKIEELEKAYNKEL